MARGGPGRTANCRRTCSACAKGRCPSHATTRPPTTARRRARRCLTGLYTHQTGCMITGGQHAEPRLSDVGVDAARTRLPHALVRQVAPHPRRQQAGPPNGASARWSATGSRAAPTPLPTGLPARAGAWTRASPGSSSSGSRPPARRASRGARRCRSSTRTTSPGGTAGRERVGAEASAPSVATQLPPNFETPEQLIAEGKPRLQLSLQETAAASFGPVPYTGPEVAAGVAGHAGSLHQAAARGRRTRRARAATRSKADRRSRRTRS